MLEVKGMSVAYGAVGAVRDLGLSIQEGEIVGLLGANGAGKSTTLGAIMGLVPKQAGSVVFAGSDVSSRAPEEIVQLGATLTPEGRHVFANLTVRENLQLGGASATDKAAQKERQAELLERFPVLRDRRDQLAGTLSGGEQQQLAIARALMSGPRLLMLDEPSLGLAPIFTGKMFQLISDLRDQGLTILLVEQNVAQTLEVADRAYVMATGEIALSGDSEELRSSTGVERAYLGLEE